MGTAIIRHNNKKGIAIFMVLFIMVVLGALMIQFHQNSRQAQSTVHRFQTSEMARQLAAAAQEEAFDYLYNQTGDIYDSSFALKSIPQKIIERSSDVDMSSTGPSGRKSVKGIELSIPATKQLAESLMPGRMELTATARIVDFRNTDYDGNLFYEREGIGTLEIVVTAKAKDEYKKQFPGACTIVRHHDYKVASIVTKKENRETSYSGGSYLDYVLFVRNGQQEFLSSPIGGSINPKDISLEVNAESGSALGKVNLGASGNFYHYINISDENKELLPDVNKTISLSELEADDSAVDKFYPAFREAVGKAVKDAVSKQGASLKSWDVKGHKAKFSYIRTPITDDAMSNKYLTDARLISTISGIAKQGKNLTTQTDDLHYYAGIKINPTNKLSDILKSDVRKLFLNYGYFELDLSNCRVSGTVKKSLKSESFNESIGNHADNIDTRVDCYNYNYLVNSDNSMFTSKLVLKELYNHVTSHGDSDIASKAFTYINDEFAYTVDNNSPISNDEQFYKPSSSETSTAETSPEQAHYPYSHFNLWNKRFLTADELEELGIYDKTNNKLHLRGIVHCQNAITLGDASSVLEVDGCGVIIAPGIYIEGSIKKSKSQDICVLFARDGIIKVKTDKEIEASLIAMGRSNKTSSVTCNEQLNLKGSIATDFLLLSQWKNGVTHKITYDEVLDPTKDVYQINISKWVSFERVLENE